MPLDSQVSRDAVCSTLALTVSRDLRGVVLRLITAQRQSVAQSVITNHAHNVDFALVTQKELDNELLTLT
jgi:hypothetical protein